MGLHVNGKIIGHKRSKTNLYMNCTLLKLDGVESLDETKYYHGKRVAYVYKTKTLKQGTKFRCMWGKITSTHGISGVVRAKFKKNLPPTAIGSNLRIMLYPSKI